MAQRPRKLSSVEESRQTALENVKRTWIEIDQLLAPLNATIIIEEDSGRRNSSSIVPQIVLELMSQHVLDKINTLFDKVIASLAAAVARIQLRHSPSPTEDLGDLGDLGDLEVMSSTNISPSATQVILLEDDVLEYVIAENILLRTLGYSIHPQCPEAASLILRWNLLRILETLVSSCLRDPRLLSHESILVPLLGLFDVCTGTRHEETDRKMMAVMNELTYCLKQVPDLLQFFVEVEQTAAESTKEIRDLRILSYLYPHLHNSGETGQLARSAVLAVLRILQNDEELNRHIAEKSNFCVILIRGLCAFYLSLPHKCFSAFSPGWHRIDPYDVTCSLDLQHFTEYVEFCNAVMTLSHPLVQEEFTKRFRDHFLLPVVTQALTQFSCEEVMAATAYFDYVLRTLQDVRLRACIFEYLVNTATSAGDRSIMDHLIGNILNVSSRLSVVTMAFFQTLLDMNYEPLLDHLVLRFLNEARPFLATSSTDTDVFENLALAQELLQLMPGCCQILDFKLDKNRMTNIPPSPRKDAFKSIFQKKSPERPEAESKEPHVVLPSYSDYLLAARYNLKNCWEAFAKAHKEDSNNNYLLETSVRKSISLFPDLELHGVNFIGPFVASLLFRLDHLVEDQNVYLGFQLTGLISRILLYPHPQIWYFLFSKSDAVQESGRFLLQILTSLKTSIEYVVPKNSLGKAVMQRTYRSLLLRTVKPESPTSENALGSQRPVQLDRPGKKSSFFAKKTTETPEEAAVNSIFSEADAEAVVESVEFSSNSPRYRRGSVLNSTMPDATKMRHAAYSAVILGEFVQELAAICQERVLQILLTS